MYLAGFLKRHTELSVKKAENLSKQRALGFSRQVVSEWFTEYAKLLDELEIADLPEKNWNFDEAGLQDQPDDEEVVAERGVPAMTMVPREKGATRSVGICFNAAGTYIPPLCQTTSWPRFQSQVT